MTWPASPTFVKTNVDDPTDSPASARGDILNLKTDVENMIAGRGEDEGVASLDSDGLVPTDELPPVPFINGKVVFGSGAGNWTVPDRITKVRCWAVGAGGGGGFVSAGTGGDHGGGGGAGGVICKVLTVVPGSLIAYSVGSHGVGKANSGDGDGTAGGNSTFTSPATATPASTTFTANGGDKGYGPSGGGTDRVGGAGGSFSTAPSAGQEDFGVPGGAGASGATRGGMGGGNMYAGGVAGATGYGGGGGFGSGGTASAFDGLDGFVMFEW
jgi:hypothetical protein